MQIQVNCIVDMYVHYLSQRQGIGKMLIDRMLRFTELRPENFTLFFPTKELLRFFHKNYMINDYIKVTGLLSVAYDLANCWTDMALHRATEF